MNDASQGWRSSLKTKQKVKERNLKKEDMIRDWDHFDSAWDSRKVREVELLEVKMQPGLDIEKEEQENRVGWRGEGLGRLCTHKK